MLGLLGEQLKRHFIHEENLIKSLGMPSTDIASHIQAHCHILEQYTRLILNLKKGEVTDRSVVTRLFKAWTTDHIVHHDLKIRAFVPAIDRQDS